MDCPRKEGELSIQNRIGTEPIQVKNEDLLLSHPASDIS
ncbi:hypothetical protein HMPREF1246_0996 [Acidaminococcus sp. BV3L6]|nr:hypothetical protein HMPREF1246_0996 [Acidaminococcus sp. BV3L6]